MFNLEKYTGLWYELLHYPSWFQKNHNYNTTALYEMMENGKIRVTNTTFSSGEQVSAQGTAIFLGGGNLNVTFFGDNNDQPNYVINKIWYDKNGEYLLSVVTDPLKQSLYLLSRNPRPSKYLYGVVMKYILENFDGDRLVQTPHLE